MALPDWPNIEPPMTTVERKPPTPRAGEVVFFDSLETLERAIDAERELSGTETSLVGPRGEDGERKELPHSGVKETFPTGAQREAKPDRGRFDLIPELALSRLAIHYERGARIYGDRNWEKGLPNSSFYNSAIRHLLAFRRGDTAEDHLAAIAWNIFSLMFNEVVHPKLNDLNVPESDF